MTNVRSTAFSLLTAAILFVGTAVLSAQSTGTGTINGTVADGSGARVANAKVTATQASTGLSRSTITNGEGLYVLPALRSGSYEITVEAPGFETIHQAAVTLDSDSTKTVDVATKIGQTTEVVNVDTAPPAIEASSGALGDLISGKQVSELPLNGKARQPKSST